MLRGTVESRIAAGRTDDSPVPKNYGMGRSPHCCGTSYPAELIPSYLEIHKDNFTRQKKGLSD